MTPYDLTFPIVIYFIAILTAQFLAKSFGATQGMGRQSALDGLRGIMALAVFICHAAVWHVYLKTESFDTPDTGVFRQFAKTGVYTFFMITSFLFTSKLINEREKGVDWTKLFVSRALRITPLYITVVTLMILLVLMESNFKVNVTWAEFLTSIAQWVTFTIFGEPVINNYIKTLLITSHVQWTLVYEWLFYISLPLLALALGLRVRVPLILVVASALLVLLFTFNMANLFFPRAFLAGILTAMIVRFGKIKLLLSHPAFSVLVIALVLWQGWNYPEASYQQPSRVPSLCLTISFIIIACGNNLFGFLSSKPAHYLGDISYGVYLLHGIIIFCIFKYIVGFEQVRTLSPIGYWSLVSAITVLVIIASTFSYHTIEAPAMRCVSEVSSKIKAMFLVCRNNIIRFIKIASKV